MVPRALAVLGLSVLLCVSLTVEARSSSSLSPRRLPSEGQQQQHHRHRHASRHQASPDDEGGYDYGESEEELSREEEAPGQMLLDRLRYRRRETSHQHHHRRRFSGKLLLRESAELVPGNDADEEEPWQQQQQQQHARGKRHYRRRTWTAEDLKSFNDSRLKMAQFESESAYEVEVREAQNSSLCNYTVVAIPDPGGRVPRELEHVKCNHAGSRCQDKGTYCCIQTYRNVEVTYAGGKRETMKVYSGCVCAVQSYGSLEPYAPDVNIND